MNLCLAKELSYCHKLKFSIPNIFATGFYGASLPYAFKAFYFLSDALEVAVKFSRIFRLNWCILKIINTGIFIGKSCHKKSCPIGSVVFTDQQTDRQTPRKAKMYATIFNKFCSIQAYNVLCSYIFCQSPQFLLYCTMQ